MHAATKRRVRFHNTQLSNQLPKNITKQLEKIYAQSFKKIKRHPYRTTSSVLLGIGIASSIFFLIRYLQNNR